MASGNFFGLHDPIQFKGKNSSDPLSFRHYDRDAIVHGKRLEDILRPAVCYWHTLGYDGLDPFGGRTINHPWAGDSLADFERKADAMFDLLELLGVRFFTFHDRDIAPEGSSLGEYERNVRHMAEYIKQKMGASGVSLLWGTANLFYDKRYMAGAATNPDPHVFAYACAQVKTAFDVTHELGGANFVVWGGREGYETLLNTDISRELDQFGRFISLVVDHKHRLGFKGPILIEPKPQEPTKHQYDYDVATVYGFLRRYDLLDDVKVNIEAAHAVLAGHSFEHEIATAMALGVFGSIDINRNDYQSGWDTDQFPTNASELVLPFYYLLRGGGFTTGGLNFDARIRRQSIGSNDVVHAHIGGLDSIAKALKAAAALIEDGRLSSFVEDRYAGWNTEEAKKLLTGETTLEAIASGFAEHPKEPTPRSGQQEYLENLLLRYQ